MLKASLKGNFEIDKTIGGASLSFDAAGYFKLRATVNDATVVPCPSFKGFTLSVEKPNLFIIDFNILEKDVDRFQLMNTRKIAEKTLKLTFVAEETNSIVDGSLVIDPRNKLSLNYMLATNNCKLKYTYGHEGIATFEPCYDLVKHVWDFSVLRKICDTDTLKTTYQCSSKMLGFEWSWNPKSAGSFKQVGGAIVMDADATTKLHKGGVLATDDSSKYIWFQIVAGLKSRVDAAIIPAAKKADIMAKIVLLQNEVRKAQKKIAEQNLKKSVKVATEAAEPAASDGKTFCIIQLDVGLDATTVREAVSKVVEKKGMSIMVFNTDETTNKAVVCARVPDKSDQFKRLDVTECLTTTLGPLKGRCGKGKSGLASGQGTDATQVKEALDMAASFASLKLN